uniref:CUB domain-containing protein n=1 Tax=Daphnia galeata TaxID=27404 RepID=A0A8J2RN24_9CRUS|nr:unnamed protein product [Daphnia galeata]
MILLTVFQFTMVFEILFFLLWAFPKWANLPATKLLSSELKQNELLLDGRTTLGSCHVQEKCGLCTNTTSEGGTIESSSFPADDYAPDLNCQFEIQSPSGSQIHLTFTDFAMENKCCDLITVFDGENDPFELRLNGQDIPEEITSTSGQIKIKFTSNSNNSALTLNSTKNVGSARWQARYKFLIADDNKNLVNQQLLDTVNSTNYSTDSNNV